MISSKFTTVADYEGQYSRTPIECVYSVPNIPSAIFLSVRFAPLLLRTDHRLTHLYNLDAVPPIDVLSNHVKSLPLQMEERLRRVSQSQ